MIKTTYVIKEIVSKNARAWKKIIITSEHGNSISIFLIVNEGVLSGSYEIHLLKHLNMVNSLLTHLIRKINIKGLFAVFNLEKRKFEYYGDDIHKIRQLCRP